MNVHLESQLLEEPLVFAGLVTLLELGPDSETGLLLLHGIFKDLLVQVGFVKGDVNGVARGHHVVVVNDLEDEFFEHQTENWLNAIFGFYALYTYLT